VKTETFDIGQGADFLAALHGTTQAGKRAPRAPRTGFAALVAAGYWPEYDAAMRLRWRTPRGVWTAWYADEAAACAAAREASPEQRLVSRLLAEQEGEDGHT